MSYLPERKDAAQALDHALILKMRRDGFPITHIAEVIRCSPLAAMDIVRQALAESMKDARETAAEMRELELTRLDVATQALMPRVEAGDLDAIDKLLKVQARRSKYVGLDVPVVQKQDVQVEHVWPEWLTARRLAYQEQAHFSPDILDVESVPVPRE